MPSARHRCGCADARFLNTLSTQVSNGRNAAVAVIHLYCLNYRFLANCSYWRMTVDGQQPKISSDQPSIGGNRTFSAVCY
jgi:hypothetical protein